MGIGSLYGQGQLANRQQQQGNISRLSGMGARPGIGPKGPAPFMGRPGMTGDPRTALQNMAGRRPGGIAGLYQQGEFMGRPGMESAGPSPAGVPGVGPTPLTAEQADANFAASQVPATATGATAATPGRPAQLEAWRGGVPAWTSGKNPNPTRFEGDRVDETGRGLGNPYAGRPGPGGFGMGPGGPPGFGGGIGAAAGAAANPNAMNPEGVNRTRSGGYGGRPAGKGGKGGGKGKGGGGQYMNQYGGGYK